MKLKSGMQGNILWLPNLTTTPAPGAGVEKLLSGGCSRGKHDQPFN